MFAVGHLSIAYLIAKASSKLLKVEPNLSLIFLLGLIPDADLLLMMLIPGLQHRTLTHSIIIIIIALIPIFIIYKKMAVPYSLALLQHVLIGDLLTGEGIQLFWPITQTWYGLGVPMESLTNILVEWLSFLTAFAIMFATKDIQKLLSASRFNLLLLVPLVTVLLPSFLSFPLEVPLSLLVPHLVYLGLFTASLLIFLKSAIKSSK